MKRTIPLLAALLLLAFPAFARNEPTLVDDVIRMVQAGVGDESIIAFVKNSRDRYEVSADDVIAMTDAHVSKEVIKVVIDEAADRKDVGGSRVYIAPFDPWFYPYWYDPFWYQPRLYVRFSPRFGGRHRGHR